MQNISKSIVIISFMSLILSGIAQAQIPQLINYQGILIDPGTGDPIADGSYQMVFSIYNVSSGGSAIWTETYSVETKNGLYSVLLGSTTALTSTNLSGPEKYLGIKVGADPEMTPRKRIVSVAYAYISESVSGMSNVFPSQGNVGIGTTTPSEKLQVAGTIHSLTGGFKFPDASVQTTAATGGGNTLDQAYDQGGAGAGRTVIADAGAFEVSGIDRALFTGTLYSGTISVEGAGTRMLWYPNKAAFRAGHVDGTQWDDGNTGLVSTAMGWNTEASGQNSTAIGIGTKASGYFSAAIGHQTEASGNSSAAIGYGAKASNLSSTAIGHGTEASGVGSTVIGYFTKAGGRASTALGSYASTSGDGSLIIGDYSTTTTLSKAAENRFYARFANGYYFYTDANASMGANLLAGANSWSSFSDSTKKENFKVVDGESILKKISHFRLGTWNYKGQDPQKYRHYGPMAQDFFAAFGHDGIGTIGNDTTLSSADFDGINFIAIQALEKRTKELRAKTQELDVVKEQMRELKALVLEQNDALNRLRSELAELNDTEFQASDLHSDVQEQ